MLAKEILSLQHPIVKHLVQVRQSRSYREEHPSVLVTGINVIKELATEHRFKRVLVEKGYSVPFPYEADETILLSQEILAKITALENPEKLVVEIKPPLPSDLSLKKRILLLDRISDPGNMGTLLRTALAFGWDGVFVLEGSVDLFNDKVLRASKGSIFALPFQQGNEDALKKLLEKKAWKLLAATAKGQDVKSFISSASAIILAIGNESHGLGDFISRQFIPIGLPMKGKMESLNAAVAGAIFLYLLQGDHG